MKTLSKKRCAWVPVGNVLYEKYHDEEWGVPVRNDRVLFEFLILEGAQAGLSWETVLKKRVAYRKAFANFDHEKVAKFTKRDVERLMKNEGIIRNRLKIGSAINNTRLFLEIQKEYGSFSKYAWAFVKNQPLQNKRKVQRDVPAVSPEAEALAKDMKKRGFKFFGPTICYAFMQATGMVNDHLVSCFRYKEVLRSKKK